MCELDPLSTHLPDLSHEFPLPKELNFPPAHTHTHVHRQDYAHTQVLGSPFSKGTLKVIQNGSFFK